MKVRYRRALWVTAAVLASTSAYLLVLDPSASNLILFALLAVFSWRFAFAPAFTVEPEEVVIHALVGPLERRHPYDSISLEGGRVSIRISGQERMLRIFRALSDQHDWNALARKLERANS